MHFTQLFFKFLQPTQFESHFVQINEFVVENEPSGHWSL